jgi:hypothetical protein
LKFLRGIAAGLDYAHQHGVVHRDVKPANVLLGADDAPVLADFGLAKLLQGTSLRSMTGVTTGTPAYMAPEQVTGNKVGPAADRYSLATIAYEMLTGVIPFDGEALMELLYAQVHRDPQLPSSRATSLSPEVDAVIMKGLAKDPAARWESCTAFVEALADALAGAPAPRAPKTMVMPAPVLASTVPLAGAVVAVAERPPTTVAMPYPAPAPAATVAVKERSSRRKSATAIVGAALLILLLLLAVVALSVCSPVTMAVSPNVASPGETVVVTAANVPANQAGVIELHSIVRTYPFRASSSGKVSVNLFVPLEGVLGNHVLKICWNNTCHAQTTLRVVSGVAMASPNPIADTSPGTSPTPGSTPTSNPTPGSTPQPTSNPTSRPTSPPTSAPRPSPTPTQAPKPTPTPPPPPSPTPTPPPPPPTPSPTPNPCPTSPQAAVLSQPAGTYVAPSSIPVAGQNFTPNKQVTVTYKIGTTSRTISATVQCNGTFSTSFAPRSLLGSGTVTATDAAGRTATAAFSILL